ncbi:hypothetical protein PoB_005734600 [Plakobranchus ocellatus]|uniref:Uncharacterized protein n=1 Tax=Plakobranchus ocellatus TaxID=259542 RepID=A0AAV4CHC9_9GAST|nr:hypothetical protein PoB_005734600 [Plakobranchus ocellatus]
MVAVIQSLTYSPSNLQTFFRTVASTSPPLKSGNLEPEYLRSHIIGQARRHKNETCNLFHPVCPRFHIDHCFSKVDRSVWRAEVIPIPVAAVKDHPPRQEQLNSF